MSSRAPKTNQNQWVVLVDFLLEHPEMVTKSFVGLEGKQNYKKLWDQAAIQLNSMGFGSITTEKWIEAFSKWKSKVKLKAQNIRLNLNKTGGGGPLPPLLPVEEKLMGIIGWTAVEGDTTTELGFENISGNIGTQQESSQVIFETIKMPDLVFIKKPQSSSVIPNQTLTPSSVSEIEINENVTTEIPSTSFTVLETVETKPNEIPSKNMYNSKNKKGKVITKTERRSKVNRSSTDTNGSRKSDNLTLLRMHQENMVVLKEISRNIARIADSHEALVKQKL